MQQTELDKRIKAIRLEKSMLKKSLDLITDDSKKLQTEKKIVILNNDMKKLREQFKKEKIKDERN